MPPTEEEMVRELRRATIVEIVALATRHGFAPAFSDDYLAVSVIRYGIAPFIGSLAEAHAYLTGWDRCATNEGRS